MKHMSQLCCKNSNPYLKINFEVFSYFWLSKTEEWCQKVPGGVGRCRRCFGEISRRGHLESPRAVEPALTKPIKWGRRKVQAQRKFAQGAFVPPSNNVAERRRDVTPKDDASSTPRVVQNTIVKMPAKSLLDVVAFKSMHNHLQPVVLLKRLPESRSESAPPIKEKPPENNNCEVPNLFKTQRYPRPKNTIKAKALHAMKLRSRQEGQSPKRRPKAIKRSHPEEPMPVRPKRRRAPPPSTSEFSVDDYKPLTYFTKKLPEPVSSSTPVPGPSHAPDEISETPQKSAIAVLPPRDAPISEELLSSISLAMDKRVISLADLLKFSCGSPSDLNKKLIADGLAPIAKEQASGLLEKLKGPYYSSTQIARWVDACRQTATPMPNDIATEMFKAPLPPPPPSLLHKRVETTSLDNNTARGDDDTVYINNPMCPSVKYITVKDVLVAPKHEISARCKKCRPCSRVDKVHKIATLVLLPLGDKVNLIEDIYEFKPNDDMAISNTRMSRYRGGNRQANRVVNVATNTSTVSSRATSAPNGGEPLYLDLLPEHGTHTIQIMSDSNNAKIMRARLIPKSQVTSANELSLIEHENLLDQLVITLKASNYEIKEPGESNGDRQQIAETSNLPINLADNGTVAMTSNAVRRKITSKTSTKHQNKTQEVVPENIDPSYNQQEIDDDADTVIISNVKNFVKDVTLEEDNILDRYGDKVIYNRNSDAGEGTSRQSDHASEYENSRGRLLSVTSTEITETRGPSLERVTRSPDMAKSTLTRSTFPKSVETAKLVDAPVFYPSEAEFKDPIAYFEKIMPSAAKFGLCKVVPPAGFKPTCNSSEDIRFNVMNQYVARMYSRWGPAQREMCAIKAYLASQSVIFTRAPLLDCMEVDLPKLYHMVQNNGGLKKVIEKKRWSRVADDMRNSRCLSPGKKLDFIYVKYVLPYGTLSHQERQDMMRKVEKGWFKKNQKMHDRAMNPLHRQKKLLGESDSSADEEEEDENVTLALMEAEDCVVLGRHMNLAMFKRTAANMMTVQFPPTATPPTPSEVESQYWKIVLLSTSHVCVNSASIDTGTEGYGFTKNKNDPYGKHPWNLKMLSQNSGNILRSLGPVLGVTVPTLHLGMLYSTSCWHRDPHGLPWVEFMHTGPGKIWYGIPDEQSHNFRKAVEKLCPTSCQNKSIWLPSDITMIPPNLLCEHSVSLSRVVQEPGEYIIVFPKAYSCSIATGYTQSESVYFAPNSWLHSVHHTFQEVRESCEPTMFSLEQLLVSVARDPRVSLGVLQQVHAHLSPIVKDELDNRRALHQRGFKLTNTETRARKQKPRRRAGAWNVREQDECEICRTTLYFSKVTNLTAKKACVCLQHALQLIDLPIYENKDLSAYEVVLIIPDSELQNIINNLQRKLSL